uniref:C2H2-type domain-containing protein n=1 Tax=Cajanus cajan TaxID=3821 RepID=A0A151THM2_CAJCA|nr:hypothetical protein KK1_012861 [Cajanus cajan]
MKTPWQVLEELCGGSSTPVAVAPVSEGVLQPKKRKTSEVRDPPRGKPICPVCNKEFTSWKAAFGHMRAHPNRDYRGFYKPPAFPSSSSSKDQPPPSANNNKGKANYLINKQCLCHMCMHVCAFDNFILCVN